MNERILNAINEVFSYAGHVDDWRVIKKELLKVLHPNERKSFSTRDPSTKIHCVNDLESQVATFWSELSGRLVIFKENEKHK